jgi:multiple sugar transport system permease protein
MHAREEGFVPHIRKSSFISRYENSNFFPITLIIPVLAFFIVWNIIPLLWMYGLSFYNYSMITGVPERFIGFGNYLDILINDSVWHSFGRTFLWLVSTVGSETVLGILLGFLFWNSADLPGRRFALTLLFTPMLLAPASTGTFFRLIYDPVFGILNHFINEMGFEKIDFLGDLGWAFPCVALVDIWMWTPFMILITLAALGAVPKAELEAARIDRIPLVKRLFYIIFPYGKFILMLGVILRTIESFKTMDLVYLMTKGGPGNKTELIAISLWRKAFEGFTMGWSSALAVLMLLTAIAFTSIFLYILKISGQKR